MHYIWLEYTSALFRMLMTSKGPNFSSNSSTCHLKLSLSHLISHLISQTTIHHIFFETRAKLQQGKPVVVGLDDSKSAQQHSETVLSSTQQGYCVVSSEVTLNTALVQP